MSDNLGFEGFTKINTPKEQPNTEMSFEAEGFKSLSKIQPTEQDSLKSIIQMSLPGGDQEEIAATIGLVNKFSGIYGTDINDTLNSLDSMVADYFQQTIPRKDAFRAIQDEFKISRANNEMAFLVNRALNTNDEAERAKLFEQVKEVEKFMPSPDMVNRGLGTKFMKAAASLTGSTLDSLIVGGAVGAMAAPVLAAMGASSVIASLTPTMQKITMMAANTLAQSGATFVTSTALERGSIAKDMLDNGIDIETVKKVSATYGMIAGAIETAGIEVMLSRFPGLKQLTQKAFMTTAIKERAKQGIAKGIMQIAKDNLIQIPVSILSEVTTETLQTLVEIKAVEVGRALDDEVSKWNRTRDRADGDYIPEEYKEQVKQQLIETAKQTAMGMAVMGGVGAGMNIAIDTRTNTQQTGKYTTQQKKVAEIKKGKAEKQTVTTEAIKAQESARAAFNENPTDENLASLQKADEVVQKMNIQAEPADDMLLLEAERQELLADTPSVENIARLNAISESMEMMQRKEMPVSAEKQIWQMTAEEYEQSLQNDTKVMAEGVMDTETAINENRFRDKIKSITSNALPEAEIDAIITLFKTQAANTGVDFETYLNSTFDTQIAVTGEQSGVLSQQHKGAVIFKQGKALVVLGKKADFSTWVHEAGHIFRTQLNTDLMTRAENYYGVQGNKWTVPQEEAFTEDLTTYLMTGQAPTAELRNVFQIIADALIAIYKSLANRGEISPEIKAVFDEMFQTESSILFQGELYHGSPHSFDKFSTSAIGTGEGAQAFGWGLYFTEEKGIAREYAVRPIYKKVTEAAQLNINGKIIDLESARYNTLSQVEQVIFAAATRLGKFSKTNKELLQELRGTQKVAFKEWKSVYKEAIELVKSGQAGYITESVEGQRKLYKVSPAQKADFDEMTWLDWDKPISEQQDKLIEYGKKLFNVKVPIDALDFNVLPPAQKALYESITSKTATGYSLYTELAERLGSDKEASLFLNRAGIDGIRYPANFLSGGNKDGKSNYVIFDENAVQIKERILFQSEITPEQQKAFDSAVTAHGLTNDINEAGYVLPDGKMLDFSGRFNATGYKKQGDKFIAEKDDYLKNNRSADHRDILYTDRADNGNEAMQNFISMGAIRIDADAGVVDMATLPTAQQYKVIQRVIENAGGATVEINYNGNSVNFDSEATPAKIIGQIKQFFKTGVINERMLFQSENPAHRDAVERAVEQGLYVPDEVISQYISEQWAQEEISARTDYSKDALEYLSKPNGEEEYMAFEIAFSDKPRSYFKAIWDNIQPAKVMTRDQSNKAFTESLDKDTLTGYLKAYRYAERQVAFPDTFMQNSYYGLLKNRSDLTEGEYKQLMVKIKADPQTYREFFATVFEDDAALAQLQRERELFPDATALEKLRAENKRLRKENKDYGKSVEQLKQSASLFAGQRDYARMQGIYLNDALSSAINESLKGEKAVKAELTDVIKDARAESTAQVKAVKADAKLQMKKERILNAVEKRKLKSDLLEGFKQDKENKKQIALMEKLIKQIMKKPSAMVERSYAERIEAIQAKYRAQRTSPQRMEFLEWAKNQMLTADDKTKAELQKEISKVSLKDLTIDELMKIADEVRELALAGFTVRQNYLMDQKIMRGETADKIVQENKTDKTTGTFGTVGTGDEKKGSIYKNIAATWFDMRRLSKILGKTSEEFLTDKVHEARNEEIRNQLRRKKAGVDKMKELNITPAKLAEKVIFESDTRPINRNSILGFYIAMQNDDTLAKIYYGNLKNNPMRDRFLEEVNENISAEEIAFANWMMDSLSGEDRDRFFDAVLEDTNTRPEAVARYFPAFVADSNTDTHELNKELAQEVLNRSPYGKAYPSKKNAISRLKNISPEHQSEMRVDALGVYFEIIDRSEHFIAFGKLIKDLQAIYNKKEVKEAIALKHGKQFNNTIQTYLNITANPAAYRNQIAQTKFFGSMVSNSIVAPLLFNIPSVLKNVTGFFLYMRESSLTEMAAAQAEIAVNYNKVKSFVYENSPKVEDRAIDDYLQKLDYSLNNPEIGRRAVKEIQKIGLTPLTLMDSYTVIVGWYAVYKTEMKRSGDHEAAVKLADDVFLKTQPQSRPEDSPIVYQDKTLRPFLAFTRQTNQIFQMIAADTPQHLREGKYRQFVFDMVAISMTAIIIGMITRRRPQEDEEELLKDLVAQFAVSLPLVGGTLSNMVMGSFYADRGFNLPIASTVAQAYRTAETVFDEYGTSEEMIDEGIRLATEAMKVYGLPSVLTQRAFKAWEEAEVRYVLMGGIPQE